MVVEENNDYLKHNDEEFIKKHPNSILAAQAKMNLQSKKEEKPKPIKKRKHIQN